MNIETIKLIANLFSIITSTIETRRGNIDAIQQALINLNQAAASAHQEILGIK